MWRVSLVAVAALTISLAAASPLMVSEWSVKLPYGPAVSPLAFLSGTNYFVQDVNGTVWSIDTVTHKIKWSLRWDDVSCLLAYPEQDTLIVLLQQGTWGVRASTGELLWVNNTVQLGTSAVAAGKWLLGFNFNAAYIEELTCYDPATGAIQWATPLGEPFAVGTIGNMVLAASNSVPSSILAFNVNNGSLLWNKAYDTFVGAGNGVVVALNQTNASSLSQDLYLLDPATGNVKLHIPNFTYQQSTTEFVFGLAAYFGTNGNVILSDSSTFISAFDNATYTLLWNRSLAIPSLPLGVSRLILTPKTILAVSNFKQGSVNQLFNVSAFRRDTGEFKWTIVTPPTTGSESVLYFGAYIYIPNLIGFTVWSEATGTLVYNSGSKPFSVVPGTQFSVGNKTFIAQTPDGSVSAFNF